MPATQTYPPHAQLRVLATRLATLAEIPDGGDYRDDFCKRICEIVLKIRKRDRRSTGAKPGGLLIEAADAARTLQQKFCRMNERDRDWVETIKQSQMQFTAGELGNLEATIWNITTLLHTALGQPSPLPDHLDDGSRQIKDQMLRELVFGLLAAAGNEGGKLTFNVNSESGTLAQALRQLRDYLPKGLVPDPLPSSTIQRLKSDFGRLRR